MICLCGESKTDPYVGLEEEALLKELDEQLEQSLIKELLSDIKFTWIDVVALITEQV